MPENSATSESQPFSAAQMPEPEIVARLRDSFGNIERSFGALAEQFVTALQETKDKLQRAEADMANLQARTRRDIEDARLYGLHKFARDVVEAAENLKRGINSLPRPDANEPEIITKMRDGFEGVDRAFTALLERNGIDRQDPTGALFD